MILHGLRDLRPQRLPNRLGFHLLDLHDKQAERDALVKRVFPELRRRCRGLQVEFVGVDLRWGITEEQAARLTKHRRVRSTH